MDTYTQELIQGLINRDPDIEKSFYNRCREKLLLVLKRRTKNLQDAEDVIQDTFIKIHNNIDAYKGSGSFEGWINRIAINTAYCKYRPMRYEKECFQEVLPENSECPVIEDQLGSKEILKHIEELPKGYKQVFKLVALDELSHEETSALLGIKSGTSRSQYAKARGRLQEALVKSELPSLNRTS